MLIVCKQFKVILHVSERFLDFTQNDNSTHKIFFADRDLTSIFGTYRIRSVREFIARPEAGFFVARSNDPLAALYFRKLENAHNQSTDSQRTPEGVGEI